MMLVVFVAIIVLKDIFRHTPYCSMMIPTNTVLQYDELPPYTIPRTVRRRLYLEWLEDTSLGGSKNRVLTGDRKSVV